MDSNLTNKLDGQIGLSKQYNYSDYLINIFIGLIIGVLIGYVFFKKVIKIGPDSNEIIGKINTDDKGDFVWEPIITICPIGTTHTEHPT